MELKDLQQLWPNKENAETVGYWALKTFGEPHIISVLKRLVDEVIEAAELSVYESTYTKQLMKQVTVNMQALEQEGFSADKIDALRPSIGKELADVVIVAYHAAAVLGVDLDQLVTDKMRVNRNRKWKINPNGTGQHVEET